jgi:hypothetical protein
MQFFIEFAPKRGGGERWSSHVRRTIRRLGIKQGTDRRRGKVSADSISRTSRIHIIAVAGLHPKGFMMPA